MTEKIQAVLMIEILGKPAEHIKKVLSELVEKLGKEKDVALLNKRVAEPKQIPEQENIFTSFAEVELQTSLQKLMLLIFAYMPSHIDIVMPEDLKIKNTDLNLFLNELTRKLHQYDELAKAIMIERQTIAKQIQEGKIKIEGLRGVEGIGGVEKFTSANKKAGAKKSRKKKRVSKKKK